LILKLIDLTLVSDLIVFELQLESIHSVVNLNPLFVLPLLCEIILHWLKLVFLKVLIDTNEEIFICQHTLSCFFIYPCLHESFLAIELLEYEVCMHLLVLFHNAVDLVEPNITESSIIFEKLNHFVFKFLLEHSNLVYLRC
jgi:hypothetical protein